MTEELAPAEFFQKITDMTLDKYPALKGKPPRIKPTSAVEGGGAGRGGRASAETFENLPPEGSGCAIGSSPRASSRIAPLM
jgi:hypothetical protein